MKSELDGLPVIRIGLLWHSVNSGNLGVGALTFGNIALLRRACSASGVKPEFIVIGFPDQGRAVYLNDRDVEICEISSKSMLPGGLFSRTIARCDLICDIGAGDSFTDIYSAKRFGFLWLSKIMTVLAGKPLVFSPQTIGPFTGKIYRIMARVVLERAMVVFGRDPASVAATKILAPKAEIRQSVDVAFAMPFDRAALSEGVMHIGVNVSGLLFNGGYEGTNKFGLSIDYPAYTRQLLGALVQKTAVQVHLISHANSSTMANDDDGRVADQLATEFPGMIRVPDFSDPVQAKSYISGLDALVAARMHACIAAYSSGVAVIPVAYSRKFSGLFEGTLGYPHMVPVTGMTTEQAVAYTLDRIDCRADLAHEIDNGNKAVAALLQPYIDTLADLVLKHRDRQQS